MVQSVYCQIADTLGVDASLSQKERADEVVKRVCALVRTLEIPTDLSAYHVSRDDIDFLTDSAFEVKRLLDQNPKPMTKADIRKIYETLVPA
ncbi:MAG: iron-containing alcohol dehydrogenase [Oscillospiraceae bacterium]|nr:iron-containing alcohol dehydrogenase [Oscillospiraceae bacterium]